ncbi:hypothetical protein GQ53DRAFT_399448 [Thozetella sp. PMI_491]|nr:hypothetical protein GQ53DRAFT_399448 [Thozetella sp. PMI_491]
MWVGPAAGYCLGGIHRRRKRYGVGHGHGQTAWHTLQPGYLSTRRVQHCPSIGQYTSGRIMENHDAIIYLYIRQCSPREWSWMHSILVADIRAARLVLRYSHINQLEKMKVNHGPSVIPALVALCAFFSCIVTAVNIQPSEVESGTPIYILGGGEPALAVRKAIQRLADDSFIPSIHILEYRDDGRGCAGDVCTSGLLKPDHLTDIIDARPTAKFILPKATTAEATSTTDYDRLIRELFACHPSDRFIELNLHAREHAFQGETWVALCEFLGLGYSVVERLQLRQFPLRLA